MHIKMLWHDSGIIYHKRYMLGLKYNLSVPKKLTINLKYTIYSNYRHSQLLFISTIWKCGRSVSNRYA